MPVTITRGTGNAALSYSLVPAPLVSFNKQIFNNIGRPSFGSDYSISLEGTLIQTHGNPVYVSGAGGTIAGTGESWTQTPTIEVDDTGNGKEVQPVGTNDLLAATISKQEYIRWLFSAPSVSGVQQPLKIKIDGWGGSEEAIEFYGYAEDISFPSEGRWALPTTYNVNLKAASFVNSANNIFEPGYTEHSGIKYAISSLTDNFDIQEDGRFIASYSDINAQGSKTLTNLTKVFSVSRSITAVGMPVYDTNGAYRDGLEPWQQASGYIYEYIQPQNTGLTPSGKYNPAGFNEAGLSFQETIDREGGTYTLTKNYTLYSGEHPVVDSITIDKQVGENHSHTIVVQGNIQGLNTIPGVSVSGNAYINALHYYTGVLESDGGTGIPNAYYFARTLLGSGNQYWLHPKPLSKSAASDFSAGTISYSYTFDDRPPNIVEGSISESIQIADTYPGEIFSVTPVIGRSQPVLQYLNSRSEYKRSLNINITMGPIGTGFNPVLGSQVDNNGKITNLHRNYLQSMFFSQKPSISNKADLEYIYQAANPQNDPNITIAPGKCYHSAPTESWDARTRTYSYSIEWTYERLL